MRDEPVVTTTAGAVRGVDRERYLSFHGIPFAAPPVGPRRFRAAEPVEPWDGVRDAIAPGPVAPQLYDPAFREPMGVPDLPQDEAGALHLTVHTPELDGEAPVYVWIHGGSYTSGSSAWATHDAANFARDGVVGVSINYRLGPLGFLDLREHFGDAEESNLALTDAICALRWIRDNIRAFGGDPGRVTIAGESAGGGMVSSLLSSPLADGLFHRAVLQSGANFMMQTPEAGARIAANLLRALDIRPGDRAALEQVPVADLVRVGADRAVLLDGVDGVRLAWNMHRDPVSLPFSLQERLDSGHLAPIDLLVGITADENKLMWLVQEPPAEDEPYPGGHELVERFRPLYRERGRGATAWEIDESITSDASYLVPTTRTAEKHAASGGRTFAYVFTWRSPVLGGRIGSCHALENAFMFDRLESPGFHGPNPPQQLATAMHTAWAEFARTGIPAAPGLPEWPEYEPETRVTMELGEECRPVERHRWAEFSAWEDVPDDRFGVL